MAKPSLLLTGAALLFLSELSTAQSQNCTSIKSFTTYNSTGTLAMPALSLSGSSVESSSSESWYITTRIHALSTRDEVSRTLWLNTGNSNTSGLGMCAEQASAESLGKYTFPKAVLERSVNDVGDCKIMFGEECVAALQLHHARAALERRTSADCGRNWNTTVPWQCAGVLGREEKPEQWSGNLFIAGSNLTRNLALTLQENNCSLPSSPSAAVNASLHALGGMGGSYNQTIRFPTPYFLTFFPELGNSQTGLSRSTDDVHVEIRCLRPDQVSEGSVVPPGVEDLLKEGDVEFGEGVPGVGGSVVFGRGKWGVGIVAGVIAGVVMGVL
ncbi:hypothetical protein P154DRAFT_158208 [Amniculicola lignicola CBS 123094]|uniref:Uncharacterized protein n=1 Tax=Amniculicola lignicola CBS 123094 TaxID=1392246 RepID=A0A6A5WLB1_9PLEO|nr:hypothetical protein P154DRAFT_158208 [Amniculicola lignicola CBS 123094]